MMLILARHGETIENNLGILQGQNHGTLSEKGIAQAKSLAEKLNKIDIDICFSSDLRRAIDTVNVIIDQRRIDYCQDERLRERYLGDFQGKTIPLDWDSTAEYNTAESMESLFNRIQSFLNDLQEYHSEKTILIVSHGITIKAITSICLELNIKTIKTIRNCSIVSLKLSDSNL